MAGRKNLPWFIVWFCFLEERVSRRREREHAGYC